MDAESIRYINAIIRNIFLIILAGLLLGGAIYTYRSRQSETYIAEVRILLGNISDPDPSIGQLNTSEQLVLIYAELARNYGVMLDTITKLDLDMTPDQLERRIQTSSVADTPILILRVSDGDADLAINLVNVLADTLIERSPTLTSDQQEQLDILQGQVGDINAQIQQMNQQIVNALEELSEANTNDADPDTISALSSDYNRLVAQRTTSQATLAQISDTIVQLADRTNQLNILERAFRATPSGGISPVIISVAASFLGILVAVGLILLREYLNNTLRNEYEVSRHLDLRVLGNLPYMRSNSRALRNNMLPAITSSPIAEDFRRLQANLLASNRNDKETQFFVVASPNSGEGRTFTAINLAIMIAQLDFKVLLVDTDIRQPIMHKVFNISEGGGLMNLLLTSPDNMDQEQIEATLQSRIKHSQQFENLSILPSGENRAVRTQTPQTRGSFRVRRQNYDRKSENERLQILGFNTLNKWLQSLLEMEHYDVIIFDSPPSLAVADVYTIAFRVAANILLIVESGKTKIADAKKIAEEHQKSGNAITGVVLNKTRRHRWWLPF